MDPRVKRPKLGPRAQRLPQHGARHQRSLAGRGSRPQALTILHVRNWFQKEAPSSKLNRTPPGMASGPALKCPSRPQETQTHCHFMPSVPRALGPCQRQSSGPLRGYTPHPRPHTPRLSLHTVGEQIPQHGQARQTKQDRPSSPTGAPNAADTPAAAPAETKSRFSVSLRKYSKI